MVVTSPESAMRMRIGATPPKLTNSVSRTPRAIPAGDTSVDRVAAGLQHFQTGLGRHVMATGHHMAGAAQARPPRTRGSVIVGHAVLPSFLSRCRGDAQRLNIAATMRSASISRITS